MVNDPFLDVEGCWNVRDAGGSAGADGRQMKQGLLYRSDDPVRITVAGRETIAALGLTGVIDLRQAPQVARSEPFIDESRTHHVPLVDHVINTDDPPPLKTAEDMGALYMDMYDRGKVRLATIVDLIIADPERPWLIHCAAGKDRTGILVAALKTVVGVSEADIVTEYALSDGPIRSRRQRMIDDPLPDDPDMSRTTDFLWSAPPGAMVSFLERINHRYGSLDAWPAGMGLDDASIARLRTAWLV
jgi:protein-tyrosine phosphatase